MTEMPDDPTDAEMYRELLQQTAYLKGIYVTAQVTFVMLFVAIVLLFLGV